MKKLVFIFLTLFILSPIILLSQEEEVINKEKKENTNFKHSLGVAAGFTTGYGLSYRFIPKKIGAQIVFAPYKSEHESQYSLGLTFIYKIMESRRTSFYIYQGNHFLFKEEKYQSYNNNGYYDDYGYYYYNNYPVTKSKESYQINNGIGIGIELKAGEHVGFNFMAGYASYDAFETINITGEFGLFFNF